MLRVCGVNPVIRILYLSGILDHPGIQYEPQFYGENYTTNAVIVENLFLSIYKYPNLFSIPLTVQYWSPTSEINISANVSLHSSTSMNLSSTAESNAMGKAAWIESIATRVGFALGFFVTDTTANVTISPGATLEAQGNISVKSEVTNAIELEVISQQNRGISPINPNDVNISYGLGYLTTNSIINVLESSSIVSDSGSVTLAASATDTNKVKVKGKTYQDGLVTFSAGTLITKSTVEVNVNGTISSGVPMTGELDPEPIFFNPAYTVDFVNNTLDFPGPTDYQTGQELIFDSADSSTIPGLVPGEVYFAITNTNQPNTLQLATTLANANSGTNISFGPAYPTLTFNNYPFPITLIDNVYTNSILFSYNPGYNGTPIQPGASFNVNYNSAEGRFIGENYANGTLDTALANGSYTAKSIVSPNPELFPIAIQLYDSNNTLVILNPNSYFTGNGTIYQVASFDTESATVDFNFVTMDDNSQGLPPLPVPTQQVSSLYNAEPLLYTAGLNNSVVNIATGGTYYAIMDPNQPGIIQLALTAQQAMSSNPVTQGVSPYLKTVGYQASIAPPIDNFSNTSDSSDLSINLDSSYTLSNNANGGTFTLTINGPDGTVTTDPLPYNISANDLQASLNSISGIMASVSAVDNTAQKWLIDILFNFEIGNIENGTQLTFSSNPNLADGTAVVFDGIQGKPVPGLVSGQTYYAFNQINPDFDIDFPQYILTLQDSDDPSTANVIVDLSQTMTDTSGQIYTIGYKDPEAGVISLYLPEVIAPAIFTSLSGVSGNATQLSSPSMVLYSTANNGTFTLTLTPANGTHQTTSAISYNASAYDIQQALLAIGTTSTVVGKGTFSSPWSISGNNSSYLVTVQTNLTFNGLATEMIQDVFYTNTQEVWLIDQPTPGTFTVTLNYGDYSMVTAPLAYNVTTLEFQKAININGFQATVYGTGTATDPWTFLAYYNSIITDDALIFNDAWSNDSLGMLNGTTYYAVPSSTQPSSSEIMLSLSQSLSNAKAIPPVLINMTSYLEISTTAGLVIFS